MRKRIAVLFPALLGGGGAECVCAWTLEALKSRYDVSLVTLIPADLAAIDRTYGTAIGQSSIALRATVPDFSVALLRQCFGRFGRFSRGVRQHLLMRHFQAIRHDYDVCFSAYNEMDFGKPGIQYLHDRPRSRVGGVLLQRLSGYVEQRMMTNYSLTPSSWLKQRYDAAYPGLTSKVVYPPVRAEFPVRPWPEREDTFLCVARLSPEKRIEDAINIVARIRCQGAAVGLRILSGGGRWPYDSRIRNLIRDNASWISLHTNVSDMEYREILGSSKFAINACPQEGFGIATAEFINAGCIPFVKSGTSGQMEAGPLSEAITFNGRAAAITKIVRVLRSPDVQTDLLADLAGYARRFSTDRFMHEICGVVDEMLGVRR